jgi:hypothetical protein
MKKSLVKAVDNFYYLAKMPDSRIVPAAETTANWKLECFFIVCLAREEAAAGKKYAPLLLGCVPCPNAAAAVGSGSAKSAATGRSAAEWPRSACCPAQCWSRFARD